MDRVDNFTVPENQASGLRVPELALRQLISFALGRIRDSVDRPEDNLIDELFARYAVEVRDQIKGWFRDHTNIPVMVNWPREDLSLPYVTVVNTASNDDAELATLGNFAGMYVLGSAGERQTARELRKYADKNTSTIFIASEDPNLTLFLSAIVRFIIMSNSDDLTRWYDMHDMTVSMQDVQWDERFSPRFCYVRAVQLTYLTYFDFYIGKGASLIVSLEMMVSTQEAGEETTVTVPSDE